MLYPHTGAVSLKSSPNVVKENSNKCPKTCKKQQQNETTQPLKGSVLLSLSLQPPDRKSSSMSPQPYSQLPLSALCNIIQEKNKSTPRFLPTTRTTTGKHKYLLHHYINSFLSANNHLRQIQNSITKNLH